MYILRLDDACENIDVKKWKKIEKLVDEYNIKPIVGIIPRVQDEELKKYKKYDAFWKLARNWQEKGWKIAMHGYNHVFESNSGGINPVNNKSEFAGVELIKQQEKIKNGIKILKLNNINPTIFFAPAHTFDNNTLKVLKRETNIEIISDTVANDIYYENGFYFIPQQSGYVRKLPFKVVTFCYHPNNMMEEDFIKLEKFLNKNQKKFLKTLKFKKRKKNIFDKMLMNLYFYRRRK